MQATEQVIVGILAGALIGHAIGANNDYHTGRTATAGAIYGGATAGASGSDAVDYSRTMAKFGLLIDVWREEGMSFCRMKALVGANRW